MQNYTHQYKNKEELLSYIQEHDLSREKEVLIQVFCGKVDRKIIEQLQSLLFETLPKSTIIGTTTIGEIYDNAIHDETIVISFSVFQKTETKSAFIHQQDAGTAFKTGQEIAKKLVQNDTKVLIVFTNGITVNSESFLKGIYDIAPHVTVAGGIAGDNLQFQETFIFSHNDVTSQGAVGVALNSSDLVVHTDHNFDWANVGKPMMITKAERNRLYEVNNMPLVDVYEKYFGPELVKTLPSVTFPLILKRNGVNIARAGLQKFEDGSMLLGGDVEEGEMVQFGYGNVDMILDSSTKLYNKFHNTPVETIFMYSCCARKILMEEHIQREISPLHQISPVSGCFVYGEFFHTNKGNELLNETMTILALSETEEIPERHIHLPAPKQITEGNLTTLIALSHLTKEVTQELTDLTETLEDKVNEQTRELRESYEKLKELDKMKNEFIAIASHELRTPMSVIKSYTSLLLDPALGSNLTEQQQEFIQKIFNNTEDLLQLVNNMLDISKLETGKFQLAKKEVEINHYIKDITKEFSPTAQEKNIAIHYDNKENIKCIINTDPDKLHRVFSNLISNAVKFTHSEGEIRIILEKKSNLIKISVKDSGIGIKKEKQEVIFEKFTQLDSHLKRDYGGTGLGLPIVKHIVEELGGKISVESTPKLGTTFTFTLPI